MKNESKNIDRYFKQRFEQFEHPPQDVVWKGIAAKLGHTRKKGLVLLFFRIAAGMTLLLSLGIGYYFVTRTGTQVETPVMATYQNGEPVKDTIVKRPLVNEKNKPAVSSKKTEKSERLEPVRKIYKGPAVREEVPSESESPENVAGIPDKMGRNQNLYPTGGFAEIAHPENQGALPVDLPATLTHNRQSPNPVISPEEALAMLLPENEVPAETEAAKQNRWILGGEIAPLYSYRTIASDYLETDMISNLNESENGVIAYAGGIRVSFSAGKRLSVQSGLYYSRYGQEKSNIQSFSYNNAEYAGDNGPVETYMAITNSTGVIYSKPSDNIVSAKIISNSTAIATDNRYFASLNGLNYTDIDQAEESDITVEQLFDYLEVPVTIKYKFIDRKFDFSFSGGLVTNFLVSNVVNIVQNGEKSQFGRTGDISQVNYLSSFGLGFEYPVFKGLAFSLEPRFRYYLNPIDKNSQINVHPYSFGFFAGINYIF